MIERVSGRRIVVVGSGHAGLCVVSALRRRGLTCGVVDDSDRLGDEWRSRYVGLHLNTERDASRIPDTTIPDSVGRWPTGEEWADHIESAADQLSVDRIRARVHGIRRCGPGWEVSTSTGDLDADVVVVATGRNRVPLVPDWPGLDDTPIEVLHAAEYRDPGRFLGRRVLVVGAGNSGTEIAHLLRSSGVEVTLSMRTRPVWARRELFGSTLTRFAAAAKGFPSWLVDLSGRAVQPLLFGRLKPYGLGPPQRRLSRVAEASGATLDSGFIADVKAGRIAVVPAVDHIDGPDVVLVGGTRLDIDAVIAATGSTPALGELLPDELVNDGWPIVGTAPFEQAPGLFTAGLNPATLTAFHPDFIAEAEQIADAIVATVGGSPADGR